MNPEDLEKRWQQKSQEAFHIIAQWQKEHPKATMAEIEAAIDEQLDQVRARLIEEIAQAERETSAEQAPTRCPQCGSRMHQRGTRGQQEVTLSRDYLSCPACGYRFLGARKKSGDASEHAGGMIKQRAP